MSSVRYVVTHVVAWVLLMIAAFADGVVRAGLLAPMWGDGPARAFSGVVMTLLTLLAAVSARRACAPPSVGWAIGVGLAWAAGTVGFEAVVTLGSGQPLSALIESYDPRRIAQGELILIGLVVMAFAPLAADMFARRKAKSR